MPNKEVAGFDPAPGRDQTAYSCTSCRRTFLDANAAWQHAKAKHGGKIEAEAWAARKIEHRAEARAKGRPDDDESIASQVIDAMMRRAMGRPDEFDEFVLEGFE